MAQPRIELPVPAYRLQAPELWLPDPEEIWFPPDDSDFFMVNLFDQTVPANTGDTESQYITPRELWIYALMASFSVGSAANPPFAFELMKVERDAQGNDQISVTQLMAVNAPNMFGTAQKPMILPRPIHVAGGTRLVCRVSNLQASSNAIQIALHCYLRDLPE